MDVFSTAFYLHKLVKIIASHNLKKKDASTISIICRGDALDGIIKFHVQGNVFDHKLKIGAPSQRLRPEKERTNRGCTNIDILSRKYLQGRHAAQIVI